MPPIPAAEAEARRFIANDPATGVLAVLNSALVVVNLIAWDPVQGDVTYSAPAGSTGGGGTRVHRFDRDIVLSSATATIRQNATNALVAMAGGDILSSTGGGLVIAYGITHATKPGYVTTTLGNAGRYQIINNAGTVVAYVLEGGAASFSGAVYSLSANLLAAPGGSTVGAAFIDFLSPVARFQGYGPDTSTNGSMNFISRRSDGSNAITWLAYASAVATLTGGLTVSGTTSLQAVTATTFTGTTAIFSGSGSTTTIVTKASGSVGQWQINNSANVGKWTWYLPGGETDLVLRDINASVNRYTFAAAGLTIDGGVWVTTLAATGLATILQTSGIDGRGIRWTNTSNSQEWEARIGRTGLENTSWSLKNITAGVVAFTIDTSGATFAGPVVASYSYSGGVVGFRVQEQNGYGVYVSVQSTFNFHHGVDADSTAYINYHGYNNSTTRFRSLIIADGKTNTIVTFAGATKLATFEGAIAVNSYITAQVSGMSNPISITQFSSSTTYGIITFNGATASTTMLGLLGRGSGDNELQLRAPSGGGFVFVINGLEVGGIRGAAGAFTGGSFAAGANAADVGGFRLPNNTSLTARNAANTGNIEIAYVNTSNEVVIGGSLSWPKFPGVTTTASGANAYLEGADSNRLYRSTSSKRYKDIVGPMAIEDARGFLIGLDPMWYRSLSESDEPDDIYPGFTAERAAELDDAFVIYDKRGRPDYVTYDRITVPIVVMLQDHESRLSSVETKLANLERAA